MPEKIGFPSPEEKPKKDIAKGEVSKDGRILSWKSDATIDPSSDLIESELKKHKKITEAFKVDATQKSSNIEQPKGNYLDGSAPRDVHTKQRDLKMERKWTRDKTKNTKLVQPLAPEDDMDIAV